MEMLKTLNMGDITYNWFYLQMALLKTVIKILFVMSHSLMLWIKSLLVKSLQVLS